MEKIKTEIIDEVMEKVKEELLVRDIANEVMEGMQKNDSDTRLRHGIQATQKNIYNTIKWVRNNYIDIKSLISILSEKGDIEIKDLNNKNKDVLLATVKEKAGSELGIRIAPESKKKNSKTDDTIDCNKF